jgi:O-antigen/teichoic acid export membrane protein
VVASFIARWTPPAPPRLAVLRSSFRFSFPLMQAALVDYISITGYVMLVGLRMPVAALGRFRIAQRLIEVLQEIAFMPARKVFMPVFVAVRHDPDRRYETTRQMLDLLSMIIFFVSAVCGAAAKPMVLLMFGARWQAAVPVFAILTLMAPATALYSVINPLLTAAGHTRMVSLFAWANAASIMAAAWFAAPFGLNTLAWALAGRGVLGVALFVLALRLGLERPVGRMLRLLVLPAAGLVAARLAAIGALAALPGLGMVAQLAVALGVSAAAFGLVVLAMAPRRMVEMTLRLQTALIGSKWSLF